MVNLRHALYSAALLPHAQGLVGALALVPPLWLTDETFAVVGTASAECMGMGGWAVSLAGLVAGLTVVSELAGLTLVGVVLGQNIPGLESCWGWILPWRRPLPRLSPQLARQPVLAAAVCRVTIWLWWREGCHDAGPDAGGGGWVGGMLAERWAEPDGATIMKR